MNTASSTRPFSGMRLYNDKNERLYNNAQERLRYIEAARNPEFDIQVRAYCLVLAYTGIRRAEAQSLRENSIQRDSFCLSVNTLKQRKTKVREVPIPPELIAVLDELIAYQKERLRKRGCKTDNVLLWQNKDGKKISKTTFNRWVTRVMKRAGIQGPQATPKGVRHGFAVNAICVGIDLKTVSVWLGHTSIETTTIYTQVFGPEQLLLAQRMWAADPSLGQEGTQQMRAEVHRVLLQHFDAKRLFALPVHELRAELAMAWMHLNPALKPLIVDLCHQDDPEDLNTFLRMMADFQFGDEAAKALLN